MKNYYWNLNLWKNWLQESYSLWTVWYKSRAYFSWFFVLSFSSHLSHFTWFLISFWCCWIVGSLLSKSRDIASVICKIDELVHAYCSRYCLAYLLLLSSGYSDKVPNGQSPLRWINSAEWWSIPLRVGVISTQGSFLVINKDISVVSSPSLKWSTFNEHDEITRRWILNFLWSSPITFLGFSAGRNSYQCCHHWMSQFLHWLQPLGQLLNQLALIFPVPFLILLR